MTAPEYWDEFLENIATRLKINGQPKNIFVTRFAWKNCNISNKKFIEWLEFNEIKALHPDIYCLSEENYNKCIGQAYDIFENDKENGCLELVNQGNRKRNFLLEWLKEQYGQWVEKQKSKFADGSRHQQTNHNWHDVCCNKLDHWRKRNVDLVLGDNRLDFTKIDRTFVPLDFLEKVKKESSQPKNADQLGKQQTEEYKSTQRYERQQDFLDVITRERLPEGSSKKQAQRLAIIGETGSGKTTLLLQIGYELLKQPNNLVIWISLKEVRDKQKSIWDYILEEWLKGSDIDRNEWKQEFDNKLKDGFVWLLLDGLEDISDRAYSVIGQFDDWLGKPKIALTCRKNRWDSDKVDFASFDYGIYECIGYNSEQPSNFIDAWFGDDSESANGLKLEIQQATRHRINDLIKYPLHLSLLCSIYEKSESSFAFATTKAELFDQFIKRQYKRKITIDRFDGDLVKSLGGLAIKAINTQSQLTDVEVKEKLGDRLNKALELGWLKRIGEYEQVYDFLHDSFKEYFAALAIDDWNDFLPSNHIDKPAKDQNDKYKEYRIFEARWKEVIIFWIGRKDEDIDKENFIKALIEFEDGCQDFYGYRAYFLAAICLYEFKDCKFAERIIEQIIEWSLDCSIDHIRSQASETLWDITRGNMNIVIPLIKVLTNTEFNDDRYWIVEDSLRTIVIGNQNDISILDQILQNPQISEEVRKIVLRISKRITISETSVICEDDLQEAVLDNSNKANELLDKLINFLGHEYISMRNMMPNLEKIVIEAEKIIEDYKVLSWEMPIVYDYVRISYLAEKTIPHEYGVLREILSNLQKIPKVNHNAISSLEYILQNEQLDNYTRYLIARTLGEIDIGNQKAVSDLIKIFQNPKSIKGLRDLAAETLREIGLYTPNIIGVWLKILKDSSESNHMRYMALVGLQETIDKLESKEIDKEHINEIKCLMANFLEKPDIDRCIHYIASDILGAIDPNNKFATTALTQILLKGNTHYFHEELYSTVLILEKILEKRNLDLWKPIVVSLRDGIINKAYTNDFDKYENCHRVLFYCSRNMSYLDFYNTWHSTVNTIQYLESQLIDCDAIQKELDRNANHPEIRCLVVDIHQLEQESDPNVIAKKLTNKIFNSIGRRTPVVQDVSCLERELLNLKFDLGVEKFAIALYGKSANEAIHQLCQSLAPIQIRLFTGEQTTQELIIQINAWLLEM